MPTMCERFEFKVKEGIPKEKIKEVLEGLGFKYDTEEEDGEIKSFSFTIEGRRVTLRELKVLDEIGEVDYVEHFFK